jgi:hypothetical protein
VLLSPIAVGAGKPALPPDLRLPLTLLQQRTFDNGTVFLRYAIGR